MPPKNKGVKRNLNPAEIKRLLRFSLVGGLNTAVDYTVFLLLTQLLSLTALPAHVFSYSAGLLNSFILNKFWTFEQPNFFSFKQVLLFVLVNLVALIFSGLMLFIFKSIFLWPEHLAKLLALPSSLSINYLGNRLWVFKIKKAQV